MKTISFIGGGRITRILLQAFGNANVTFAQTTVFDPNAEALKALKASFDSINPTHNLADVAKTDLVVIAVHPPMMMETLEKLNGLVQNPTVVLSLAPKFNLVAMQKALPGVQNLARMNPSAGSWVNKGVNPVSFSTTFDAERKKALMHVFDELGYSPVVDDAKIEAYAVISAMGHTYFNFQLQKLKELAVNFGMDDLEASRVISSMLWGTTEVLFDSGLTYAQVTDLVPVKPMAEVEETIKGYYDVYLNGIFQKIKPLN